MNKGMKITKIDELTLLKFLGKGSYGEVYLTKKDGKSELFATKKMDRKYVEKPQLLKYLNNEISILKELKNHKNIVKLEDVKVTKNHYYIVMEYCNGGSLSDCLRNYQKKTGHPFTQEIVQYLMRQIINVMKYIHSKGIIHRDLKLDNILVNFDTDYDKSNLNMMKATIKIIDFGFSTHMGNSNLCYSTVGSPINMDPNILMEFNDKKMGVNNGKILAYDQKADIWSLGTICYEMLIGKSAFNSKSLQELVKKVEDGTYEIPTHLSKEVVSFLNAMLQFNSEKRLSCNELSRHYFLTKNVNDFQPIDLRKVSNKVNKNNLNVNIKRNSTIWSIFNEDDEKQLINIPSNYLTPVIKEEDEFNYNTEDDDNYYHEIQFPFNNIKKETNNNNDNEDTYQGYGVSANGINAYQNTNEKNAGYGFSNYPEQKYKIPQDNVPVSIHENHPFIGKIENSQNNYQNEIKTEGQKIGPIAEIPSFGVPSPGEENKEGGYENSSGIFRPNINWGYTSGRGGYSYK